MYLLAIIFCILFHVLFNESHASKMDELCSGLWDSNLDCVIYDMFNGFLSKIGSDFDWSKISKRLDSLVLFDDDCRDFFIMEEDSSSHY